MTLLAGYNLGVLVTRDDLKRTQGTVCAFYQMTAVMGLN